MNNSLMRTLDEIIDANTANRCREYTDERVEFIAKEYAEQQVIEFAEWQYKNTWSVSGGGEHLWYTCYKTGELKDTAELYSEFLKSKL